MDRSKSPNQGEMSDTINTTCDYVDPLPTSSCPPLAILAALQPTMSTLSSPLSATFPSHPLAGATSSASPSASPEIESTLSRLSAYRNVRGVMILSRPYTPSAPSSGTANAQPSPVGGIVQSTGSVFEGESGKMYARAVEGVVLSVSRAVSEVDEGVSPAVLKECITMRVLLLRV